MKPALGCGAVEEGSDIIHLHVQFPCFNITRLLFVTLKKTVKGPGDTAILYSAHVRVHLD